MTLESGRYEPSHTKTVTVWKAPDKDGDGEDVWEDVTDGDGNHLGRRQVKDKDGNPVRNYHAPEGFHNIRSHDGTDTYVRVNERGAIVRSKKDEAIGIKPGHAVVEHSDGTVETLKDEYSQYLFEQAHTKVSD